MTDEIENKRIRIRDYLSGDLGNQEKQDFQEWLERDLELSIWPCNGFAGVTYK